jgi:hypothetical protein
MTTNKSKRNVVSLPEQFCNVLDNLVDDKMICNRTDALKQIILEQAKTHPDKYIFVQKSLPIPAWITKRKWFTEKVAEEFASILKIADDAGETSALITLDEVKTGLKAWEYIGVDGLKELRAMRAAKKKAAEQGAP